jgi:hypothetical protein
MATIKYNEDEEGNKKFVLKNGFASCTCCECFFSGTNNFPNPNFDYNTFLISKEEYRAIERSQNVTANVQINHFEKYGSLEEDEEYGEFSFNINSNVLLTSELGGRCDKLYSNSFEFTGNLKTKVPFGEIDDSSVDGAFRLLVEILLSNENNDNKVHYEFYLGQESIFFPYYSRSTYFSTLSGETEYPPTLNLTIDENPLNVPKLYQGPQNQSGFGRWYENPDYVNDTSVIISITTQE